MIKTNTGHQKFMNDAFYYPNKISTRIIYNQMLTMIITWNIG